MWQKPHGRLRLEDYTPYFQHYNGTCEGLYLGIRNEARSLAILTHEQLLEFVEILAKNPQANCPQLRKKIFKSEGTDKYNHSEAGLNDTINLALRLWFTIDVREEIYAPATFTTQWNDDSTLEAFVTSLFPGPRFTSFYSKEHLALGSDFTAVNLRRFGGISIDWTCNLNEHLLFERDTQRLKVYILKTCLYDQNTR